MSKQPEEETERERTKRLWREMDERLIQKWRDEGREVYEIDVPENAEYVATFHNPSNSKKT